MHENLLKETSETKLGTIKNSIIGALSDFSLRPQIKVKEHTLWLPSQPLHTMNITLYKKDVMSLIGL